MEEKNFFNLNNSKNSGFSNDKIYKNYEKFLKWSFHKPFRALILALILPLTGFISFNFLDTDFFPNQGKPMFKVEVELDKNASIFATKERVKSIREQVLMEDYIESDMWWIGRRLPRLLYNVIGGSSGEGSDNLATGVYFTNSYSEMDRSLEDLAKNLEKDHADAVSYTHLTLPTMCVV